MGACRMNHDQHVHFAAVVGHGGGGGGLHRVGVYILEIMEKEISMDVYFINILAQ